MATESGEPTSELSIMEKLLLPAAEVLAMDATDSSCGDQLLKDMGKKVRLKNKIVLSVCLGTLWMKGKV